MATERFDIEIRDKVAKSIRKEILGIGTAARSSQKSLQSLKAEMAGMSGTQARAASATATATAATTRGTGASAARGRQARSTAKALETEAQAHARLSAMVERSIQQQNRAIKSSGTSHPFGRTAGDRGLAARQTAAMTAMTPPRVINQAAQATDKMAASVAKLGTASSLSRHHLLNLSFQAQDVFVGLTSGQKPMTVFIQQGAQIAGIAGQAGVGLGAMAKALAGLLVPWIPLIAAISAGVSAFALLNRAANQQAGDLENYAKSLGLTKEEMEELTDTTVTWGDTAKAVFQVTIRNISAALGIDTQQISSIWNNFLDGLWKYTRVSLAGIYANFAGMAYGVKTIMENLGDGVDNDNPIKNMIAGYKEAYQDAQDFFTEVEGQAGENARKRLDEQAAALIAARSPGRQARGAREWDRAGDIQKVNDQLDDEIKLLQFYGDALERNTRLEQIAGAFREKGQALNDAERQHLMAKIELLQEGTRVQAAMTAADIEANGAAREFAATTEALNRLLDAGAISMAEYDRQSNMAARAYDTTTDALFGLNQELEKNLRLVGTYGVARAELEYLEQIRATVEARGESIFMGGSAAANDNGITVTGANQLRPEIQDMLAAFREQQRREELSTAQQAIDPAELQNPRGFAFVLDNYEEMYGEIERMRQENLISEEEAIRRKENLERAHLDSRLEYTGSILGQLSKLQQSKNREIAAFGKAAAIAQATIDGYRAVQAALVGPPGPPWSFAIAGVTGAMAAANVAKIAGVGFQSGGFTGTGADNSVAGQVHRNEFVFDSGSTRRIGVGTLEAMRRGGAAPASNDNNRAPVVNIMPQPGVYVEERKTSAGEIELIAKRVVARDAPNAVANDIKGNPNSQTSKALSGAYSLRRSDR